MMIFGLNRVRRSVFLALPCLLFAALVGCGEQPLPTSEAPDAEPASGDASNIEVVATVGMIADVAQQVAGDRAAVTALMRPGVDPHLYQPTRDDLAALLAADVVLYNGLKLEGRMTDALENARSGDRVVVAVAEALDEASLLRFDEPEEAVDGSEKVFDPHAWMDPAVWRGIVPAIVSALSEADPSGAVFYEANGNALLAEMTELEREVRSWIGAVPTERRVLVTAHDAFGYFGRAYGFEVLGIQGLSTESEAGVRDIERLVGVLVERQIPAVFVESTVSDRNVEALIAGAAAQGHEVTIGGELFSDAMGPEGTPEGTYLGMIRHNAKTIAEALSP